MDARVEILAKEIQMIVAADRWKGRDLSAEPPEKWHRLRPETQQFWIDTATRILAALEVDPAALSAHPAVRALVEAERERPRYTYDTDGNATGVIYSQEAAAIRKGNTP